MRALVGYTGFVGSNLFLKGQFDAVYNSKNIEEAYGTKPDILYFAGLRAEKFLANKMPEKDKALIDEAISNIQKIAPKKLVLISTIDIYKKPIGVDEDSPIITEGLHPYGYNRYLLEEWVEQNLQDYLIIRLPGLFGKNIKKNFIYDYIHVIPAMLTEEKFGKLQKKEMVLHNDYICAAKTIESQDGNTQEESFKQKSILALNYHKLDNGFYQYKPYEDSRENEKKLQNLFATLQFSALQFTDSRGVFQFYDLAVLYEHIEIAMQNGIKKLNLATEPVSTAEIYRTLTGKEFVNEIAKEPPYYDFKTKYDKVYQGKDGYLFDKETVLDKIKEFVMKECCVDTEKK